MLDARRPVPSSPVPPSPTAPRRVDDPYGRQLDDEPGGVRLDRRIAAWASRHWGVISTAELRTLGASDRQIAVRVRRGLLVPLHRGVYAVGHTALQPNGRRRADLLACGAHAALSHRSAAHAHDLRRWTGRTELIVPGPGTRLRHDVTVRRTNDLPPGDLTVVDGLTVTAWHRTVLDCASLLDETALRRLVEQALLLGLYDHATLCSAMDRRRWPGIRRLRAVLAGLGDEAPPTRSELEHALRDLVRDGGLGPARFNVVVLGRERDCVLPRPRIVLEVDGHDFHATPSQRAADAERDLELAAAGWLPLRQRWRQVRPGPERPRTIVRLRTTIEERLRLLARSASS